MDQDFSEAVAIKSKEKYRGPPGTTKRYASKHTYRARTGPRCCNANCPSSKKKGGRHI